MLYIIRVNLINRILVLTMIVTDQADARRSCTNCKSCWEQGSEYRRIRQIQVEPPQLSAVTRWRPRTRVKVHSWRSRGLLVRHGLITAERCVIALPTIVVVILLVWRTAAVFSESHFRVSKYSHHWSISTNWDEFILHIIINFIRHECENVCLYRF